MPSGCCPGASRDPARGGARRGFPSLSRASSAGKAGSLEDGVLGGAEARLCCRTAQKQCCVSYLKEKSCMAGVLGAKEGEACGDEDSDTCGVSLYKASCPGVRGPSLQVLEGRGSGQAVGLTPGGGPAPTKETPPVTLGPIHSGIWTEHQCVSGPVSCVNNTEMAHTRPPALTGLSFSFLVRVWLL